MKPDDDEIVKPRNATLMVDRRKLQKERDKAVARKIYEEAKPWHRKLFEWLFGKKPAKSSQQGDVKGDVTIVAEASLLRQGYGKTEAEMLLREAKGERVDSFGEADVVEILSEGSVYKNHVVKSNEIVVILKKKVENYSYPNLMKYKNLDWYPLSIREGEKGWEYYLKVAH